MRLVQDAAARGELALELPIVCAELEDHAARHHASRRHQAMANMMPIDDTVPVIRFHATRVRARENDQRCDGGQLQKHCGLVQGLYYKGGKQANLEVAVVGTASVLNFTCYSDVVCTLESGTRSSLQWLL